MKEKKLLLIVGGVLVVLLLVGLIVLLSSCGGAPDASDGEGESGGNETAEQERSAKEIALENSITKQFSVGELNNYEKDGITYLEAYVVLPPIVDYMIRYCEYAEKSVESSKDFGEKLYELIIPQLLNDKETKRVDVKINLSEIDSEKTQWTTAELTEFAQKEAFRLEMYEFGKYLLTAEEE